MALDREAWHHTTSWNEVGATTPRPGTQVWLVRNGPPEDEHAPVVVRSTFAPGTRVEAHTHESDYMEIILEGSEQVTRRWRRAGDITIVKAGTVYGPLIAGPEGVTKLIIFRDDRYRTVPPKEARAGRGSRPDALRPVGEPPPTE
jgi:quercetin dioxygenase-like cupin family protein